MDLIVVLSIIGGIVALFTIPMIVEWMRIKYSSWREIRKTPINFDNYINWLIADYDRDELSKYYINLDAKNVKDYEIKPIDVYINELLNKEGKNHMFILGEYGTGKTSISRKFAHDLAIKYRKDWKRHRIPIILNLKDYSKKMGIDQILIDLLFRKHNLKNFTYDKFQEMNTNGNFLLIFDGFDEMASRVDSNTTIANLNEINKWAKPQKSKIIITSRTEYFKEKEDALEILKEKEDSYVTIDDGPKFEILYIEKFNEEKIKQYLKKKLPNKWKEYYKNIQQIYDLMELAHRPILLDMITKSLPQLIERKEKTNASKLYDVYVDHWLKRDIESTRTFMNKKDKILFMQELAFKMFLDDELVIHYTELPKSVKEYFMLGRDEIDYFEHDIRTCSFLNRDGEGNYKFIHKSFMEFFVAKKIVEEIENNRGFVLFGEKIFDHVIFNFTRGLLYNVHIKILINLLKDSTDRWNKICSISLLSRLDIKDLVPILKEKLSTESDDIVKRELSIALAHYGEENDLDEYIEFLKSNTAADNENVNLFLKYYRNKKEAINGIMKRLSENENYHKRVLYIYTLGKIGDTTSINTMRNFLNDESDYVRKIAQESITEISKREVFGYR